MANQLPNVSYVSTEEQGTDAQDFTRIPLPPTISKMSSTNPSFAHPPPLPLPAGGDVPPIDAMGQTWGVVDAPTDGVSEAIRVIAEASNQLSWLDDYGSLEDKNNLQGKADNIEPLQPHPVPNPPTHKSQCRPKADVFPRRK